MICYGMSNKCVEDFPFIEESVKEYDLYRMICVTIDTVNKLIDFANNDLSKEIQDYIDKRFNQIMVDTTYVPDTETLKFFLSKGA